jgi:AraC-like DNA-binding protein
MNFKLWKNKHIPGIEFVDNSYYDHSFKPHFHDHYVILTLKDGVNIGECQNRPYAVTASDILVINPSEIHTGSSWQSRYLNYTALYVSEDFLLSQLKHCHVSPTATIWFQETVIHDVLLAALLRKIVEQSSNKYQVTLAEDITLFFAKLLQDHSCANIPRQKNYCRQAVKKSLEFIKANYADTLSISGYCEKERLSYYSFIRSFNDLTGLTPGRYLINYRVEQAKKLLQSQKPLSDVCWDTGFFDQSHFNRHFKQITGMTPGRYRSCFA